VRVTFSEGAVRRSGGDAEEQGDAQARVEQCAVTEGLEFANGVVGAEIAGPPAPGASAETRGHRRMDEDQD
jgi:hypothetical protein